MRKLLNEAIKTTFRTVAFLERESHRLAKVKQVEKHPLTPLVEENATMVYWEAASQSKNTLKKKLSDLCRRREHESITNQQEEEIKQEEQEREERVAYGQEEEDGRQESHKRQEGVTYSKEEKIKENRQEREDRVTRDEEEVRMKEQVKGQRISCDQEEGKTQEIRAREQQENCGTSQGAQDETQYSTETRNSENSAAGNPASNRTPQTPLESVSRGAALRLPEEQNVRGTAGVDGTPSRYEINRRDREGDCDGIPQSGRAMSSQDATYVSTTSLYRECAKSCNTTDREEEVDTSTGRIGDWMGALLCCKFSTECICSSMDVRNVGSRSTISSAPTYAQKSDISHQIWFDARRCACANAVECPLVDQYPQVTFEAAHYCSLNNSVGGTATNY